MNEVTEVLTDLRTELAGKLFELDQRDYGGDNVFMPYGQDKESDDFIDAAVTVFEKHHKRLLDQLDKTNETLAGITHALHDIERFIHRQ